MSSYRIAILFHENDNATTIAHSLISRFSKLWEEDGHEIFHLFGIEKAVPADLLFVHVDLSIVPDSYLEFAKQYDITVNAQVKDIRKSVFSNNLIDRDSDWNGPVIVKTDRNCGGIPERVRSGLIGKLNKKFLGYLNHPFMQSLILSPSSSEEYHIFNHICEVPFSCFIDKRVIVEKFIPEREGDDYCIRMFSFLGDRMICAKLKGKEPIVKGENTEKIERSIKPHPDIINMRRKLGFEYGKFDYVVVDGEAILLDANKTIGLSPNLDESNVFNQYLRYSAEGLYSYFKH